MKFGYRKPSFSKSFSARTTGRATRAWKKAVIPGYGKKGIGLIKNPKKALYNQIYRRTTRSIFSISMPSGGKGCFSAFFMIPVKIYYYFFVWWWLAPIKFLVRKFKGEEKQDIPLDRFPPFRVRSWNGYLENVSTWQEHNAKLQWGNARYSEKPMYQYAWTNTVGFLRAEPNNIHDKNAIAVYLGGLHIGYVPREINEMYHDILINNPRIAVSIHGGHSRIVDDSGNVVEIPRDPIAEIKMIETK